MPFFLRFPGTEVRVLSGETILGRERGCGVWIDDPSVSRRHARILSVADTLTIEDLASKNGLKLNGVRVKGVVPLNDGDLIAAGQREFAIRRAGAFDTFNDDPSDLYRTPLLRTCVACRALADLSGDRCSKCGAEAYSLGEHDDTRLADADPAGRRTEERTSVSLRALYVSPQTTIEGTLTDVSLSGGFFAAPIQDSTGTYCDLVVRLKEEEQPLKIDAEVMRVSVKPGGMGLKFLKLSRATQRWLVSVGAGQKI